MSGWHSREKKTFSVSGAASCLKHAAAHSLGCSLLTFESHQGDWALTKQGEWSGNFVCGTAEFAKEDPLDAGDCFATRQASTPWTADSGEDPLEDPVVLEQMEIAYETACQLSREILRRNLVTADAAQMSEMKAEPVEVQELAIGSHCENKAASVRSDDVSEDEFNPSIGALTNAQSGDCLNESQPDVIEVAEEAETEELKPESIHVEMGAAPVVEIERSLDALERDDGDADGASERRHQCSMCGKRFPFLSYLNRHLLAHTGQKPFACHQCGKLFSRQTKLNVHMRVHNGEKLCRCDQCGKSFTQKTRLIVHMRIHTGEKPFKCEQCGKSYNQQSHLSFHLRLHRGDKPYECGQCDKRFCWLSELKAHLGSHAEVKPFKCCHCDKRYSRSSQLKTHLGIHSGNLPKRPYRCDQCDKCFPSPSKLDAHMRVHTGEKPYKCDLCDKFYSQKQQLNAHLRMHGRRDAIT